MHKFGVYDDREAVERRQMYEDRVREAIDTLRDRVEEERAECQRLRGLLEYARAGLLCVRDAAEKIPFGVRNVVADALLRSDPYAAEQQGMTDGTEAFRVTHGNTVPPYLCECDLRDRQWNRNSGLCETCGRLSNATQR